jgi:hypothetical protein
MFLPVGRQPGSVLPDPVSTLPSWLLVGIAIGVLLAIVVAAVFAVGVRLFPDRVSASDPRDGGEGRRRAEIRQYLSSIGERYHEDHSVAGRSAPFYLPDRGIAITFDARDYFRFERAGVQAVLLEYEVPGARLGGRLPFETPEPEDGIDGSADRERRWRRRTRARERRRLGPYAEGEPRRHESAFAALGLAADASEEAVREAYRERVKDVHPDHGGDVEAFQRLREAYTVARERAE